MREKSLREMLRKARQHNNNTTERQSNTTQLTRNSHFYKKNWPPRVGLDPTTIHFPGNALKHSQLSTDEWQGCQQMSQKFRACLLCRLTFLHSLAPSVSTAAIEIATLYMYIPTSLTPAICGDIFDKQTVLSPSSHVCVFVSTPGIRSLIRTPH